MTRPFGVADSDEARRFLEILSRALSEDLPFMAVMALRSDFLGQLQSAKALTARFEEFSLGPMPLARLPQIVEGPARVAGLPVEDAFVQQAARDAETEDALPLLAFALRELLDRSPNKSLTLVGYTSDDRTARVWDAATGTPVGTRPLDEIGADVPAHRRPDRRADRAGLPFLRQLHWIVTRDPASEKDIARIFDGASGDGARPLELWRYASPYRGLEAMEVKDSDYFFGRTRETIDTLKALAAPDRLAVLIGNSGVGKSSLAQAGVLAALKRQAWPGDARAAVAWPSVFEKSRQWCFLTLKPGAEPIKALVDLFSRHLAIQGDRSRPRRKAAQMD